MKFVMYWWILISLSRVSVLKGDVQISSNFLSTRAGILSEPEALLTLSFSIFFLTFWGQKTTFEQFEAVLLACLGIALLFSASGTVDLSVKKELVEHSAFSSAEMKVGTSISDFPPYPSASIRRRAVHHQDLNPVWSSFVLLSFTLDLWALQVFL